MQDAYKGETDAAYDELLDRVAAISTCGDFHAIRVLYESNDDLRVSASMSGR
jgi:hypothetical protein